MNAKSCESSVSSLLEAEVDFVPSEEFAELQYSEGELTLLRELTQHVATEGEAVSDSGIAPLMARSLPPLTPLEERTLFRRMNYVRFQAESIRATLSKKRPSSRKLANAELLLQEADDIRRRIIESNLRLVATIARKYARSDQEFHDFVSEGLLILMAATRRFDYSRGFRFSTYVFNSIQRHLFRLLKKAYRQEQRCQVTPDEVLVGLSHAVEEEEQPEIAPSELYRRLMNAAEGSLTEREKTVVRRRFGTDGSEVCETLRDIAADLGLSKERVRQIQIGALAKLRRAAAEINLTPAAI